MNQNISPSFAKCYKYTIEISGKAIAELEISRTFAARKRGSSARCKSKLINKKIKLAQAKKVLTFAVPQKGVLRTKEKGALNSANAGSDFRYKKLKK